MRIRINNPNAEPVLVNVTSGTNRIGATYEVGGQIVDETGTVRTVNRTFLEHLVQGDLAVVAAQGAGIRIRVLSAYLTSVRVFQSIGRFQSNTTAISAYFTFLGGASTHVVLPHQPHGWCQTEANEPLVLNVQNTVVAEPSGVTITWVRAT